MKMRISLLVFVSLLFIAGSALAQQGHGQHMGGGYGMQGGQYYGTPQQSENYQKFMNETQQLRRQLRQDQAQLNALLMQDNPDPQQLKQLNQRIAETRTELQLKANQFNLQGECPYCGGPMGPGMGHGMGYGMHRGW